MPTIHLYEHRGGLKDCHVEVEVTSDEYETALQYEFVKFCGVVFRKAEHSDLPDTFTSIHPHELRNTL